MASIVASAAVTAQQPGTVLFPTEFSTHDFSSVGYASSFHEMWADVKTPGATMPGEGRTYSVGTIEIHEAIGPSSPPWSPSQFSYKSVGLPPSPARPFIIQAGMTYQTKQVAILQVSGRDPDPQGYRGPNDDQDIRWQRYFYGDSDVLATATPWPGDPTEQGPMGRKATNARAISVFPVMNADGTQNHAETRIAICGETYDSELPGSQITTLFPTAINPPWPQQFCRGWAKVHGQGALSTNYGFGLPSGFIAVYDGDGQFLWSHQFFFQEPDGFCAITDVSIRVERRTSEHPVTEPGLRDVVTYCGFSSFGVRQTINGETSSLTPLRWFDTVVPPTNNATLPALGNTDNGVGQWDGIVGRISNIHVPVGGTQPSGASTVREFHTIVGGIEQDAIWCLAELPDNRLVVGGETANVSGTPATVTVGSQTVVRPTFPFTSSLDLSTITDYCLGTVTVFDATPTLTGGNLVLESSAWLGNVEKHTACRDIAVQPGALGQNSGASTHRLAVVGTTDDALLFSPAALQVQVSITPVLAFGAGAATNGFLATGFSVPVAPGTGLVVFDHGSFQGAGGGSTGGASSWNGVANWNEYLDHLTVYGHESSNAQDLAVASFLFDTTGTSEVLQLVRSGVIPASPREEPSKLGPLNAMPGLGALVPGVFPALGRGSPPQFPGHGWQEFGLGEPTGGGGVAVDERGRVCVVGATDNTNTSDYPVLGAATPIVRAPHGGWDGVRTVFDLLPLTVGRSDGTGEQNHKFGMIPAAPIGFTGSTTPTCTLLPFGNQISMDPAPLQRMLVDWEGPSPGPTPDPTQPIHFLFIDRAPPTSQILGTVVQYGIPTPPAALTIGGTENWVPSGVTYSLLGASNPRSFRIPLVLPPTTGVTFSAQVMTFLTASLSAATFDTLVGPTATAVCSVAPGQYAATPTIVFSY